MISVALFVSLIVIFLSLYSVRARVETADLISFLQDIGNIPIERAPLGAGLGDLLLLTESGGIGRLDISDVCSIEDHVMQKIIDKNTEVQTSSIPVSSDLTGSISSLAEAARDAAKGEAIIVTSLNINNYFDKLAAYKGCEDEISRHVGPNCSVFYTSKVEIHHTTVGFNISSGCQIFQYSKRTKEEIDRLLSNRRLATHFQWTLEERLAASISRFLD